MADANIFKFLTLMRFFQTIMKSLFSVRDQLTDTQSTYIIGLFGCSAYEMLKCLDYSKTGLKIVFLQFFETQFELLLAYLKQASVDKSASGITGSKPYVVQNLKCKSYETFLRDLDLRTAFDRLDAVSETFKSKSLTYKVDELHKFGPRIVEMWFRTAKNEDFRLILELFEQELPKLCGRFIDLCNSTTIGKRYVDTGVKKVHKDTYVQFGELQKEAELTTIEDEKHLFKHDTPGLLGFIGLKDQRHTNKSQFYITLDTLPAMDHKSVVFGRVLEGLSDLAKYQESEPKIKKISVYEHAENEAESNFLSNVAKQKKPFEKQMKLISNATLKEYHSLLQTECYYGGPKVIVFDEFIDRLDFETFCRMPLYSVEKLVFKRSKIWPEIIQKLFKTTKMLPKMSSLELIETEISEHSLTSILSTIKSSAGLSKLVFRRVKLTDSSADLFKTLHQLTSGFSGIRSLVLDGCRITPESFDDLDPQIQLFDSCLERLTLANMNMFDEGFNSLLSKLRCPKLKKLNVSGSLITSKSLCQINFLSQLENLDISNNYNVCEFMEKMAAQQHICMLRKLRAVNCYLAPNSIPKMIVNLRFLHLRELYIDRNMNVFEPLIKVFQSFNIPSNLKVLSMRNCGITTQQIADLSALSQYLSLKCLDISENDDVDWNELIKSGALETTSVWTSIQQVSLHNASVTADITEALANDFGINIKVTA